MVFHDLLFQDGEMEGVSQFKELIYTMKVQEIGEDTLRKGNFSVKWCYSYLCAETRVNLPAKEI